MPKFLIVNGHRRSGTTLLERVVDSQDDAVCLSHLLEVGSIVAELEGLDKNSVCMRPPEQSHCFLTETEYPELKRILVEKILQNYNNIRNTYRSGSGRFDAHYFYGYGFGLIVDIIEYIENLKTRFETTDLMRFIADRTKTSIVSFKWTHHHFFAPEFLDRENTYWLEIVRSPYAVFASEIRGGWRMNAADFEFRNGIYEFYDKFKHPRFKLVSYEALVSKSDQTVAEIGEWIGHEFAVREIRSPDGAPFRANSSRNIEKGKSLFYQDAGETSGMDAERISDWHRFLSGKDIALINSFLRFDHLYEKVDVGTADTIRANLEKMKMIQNRRAKNLLNAAFGLLGLRLNRR